MRIYEGSPRQDFEEVFRAIGAVLDDRGYREVLVFAPLVLLVVFFGFYPAPLLDVTAVSVKKLVSGYEAAINAAQALNTP